MSVNKKDEKSIRKTLIHSLFSLSAVSINALSVNSRNYDGQWANLSLTFLRLGGMETRRATFVRVGNCLDPQLLNIALDYSGLTEVDGL